MCVLMQPPLSFFSIPSHLAHTRHHSTNNVWRPMSCTLFKLVLMTTVCPTTWWRKWFSHSTISMLKTSSYWSDSLTRTRTECHWGAAAAHRSANDPNSIGFTAALLTTTQLHVVLFTKCSKIHTVKGKSSGFWITKVGRKQKWFNKANLITKFENCWNQ